MSSSSQPNKFSYQRIFAYLQNREADRGSASAGLIGLSALLVASIVLLFWSLHSASFVELDDLHYVVHNLKVRAGLSLDTLVWAFSTTYYGNWSPLVWISYMADVSCFGLNPHWMHVENVILHCLNSLLVLYLLKQFKASDRLAFLAAFIFAIHPQHVEAVAWISSRKDMLLGFFALSSLIFYCKYVERQKVAHYLLALALFSCALMCKPGILTLPVALIFLDVLILKRGQLIDSTKRGFKALHGFLPLLTEKIPWLVLSISALVVNFRAQDQIGAIREIEEVGPLRSLGNACYYCLWYLVKSIFPNGLSVLQQHPRAGLPWSFLACCALTLAVITILAWVYRRRSGLPLACWAWFGLLLAPYLQIAQVGIEAVADRWMYLPLLGPIVCGVALLEVQLQRGELRRVAASLLAAALIVFYGLESIVLVASWYDTQSLYSRGLRLAPENEDLIYFNGMYLQHQNRLLEARDEFIKILKLNPDHVRALEGLATISDRLRRSAELVEFADSAVNPVASSAQRYELRAAQLLQIYIRPIARERFQEKYGRDASLLALEQVNRALEMEPDRITALNHKGRVYYARREFADAYKWFHRALELRPQSPAFAENVGVSLAQEGQLEEGQRYLQLAVQLNPNRADTYYSLAMLERKLGHEYESLLDTVLKLDGLHQPALLRLGDLKLSKKSYPEAIALYNRALKIAPLDAYGHKMKGNALALENKLDAARVEYERSLELEPTQADIHYNLGAIFKKQGDTEAASYHFSAALQLQPLMKPAADYLKELEPVN